MTAAQRDNAVKPARQRCREPRKSIFDAGTAADSIAGGIHPSAG
jgi:hypothetical protein